MNPLPVGPDVVMRRVYGALLVAMLIVCRACWLPHMSVCQCLKMGCLLLHAQVQVRVVVTLWLKAACIRTSDARFLHDAMPRHRKAGPRLGAVTSAPRWATGPPWAACSN